MITIQSYLYPNKVEAQIWDSAIFTTRNRQMYAKPVTIYKGIDNPIQVNVKNQDQKAVNMLGYAMQADIQDSVNSLTVGSFPVTFANVSLGRGSFTIDRSTVNSLDHRIYKLTLKTIRLDNNTEQPVYIDDNYGVPLDLHVLPAYYSNTPTTDSPNESILDGGTI